MGDQKVLWSAHDDILDVLILQGVADVAIYGRIAMMELFRPPVGLHRSPACTLI
jgi:hypothetical protein